VKNIFSLQGISAPEEAVEEPPCINLGSFKVYIKVLQIVRDIARSNRLLRLL
jgi:hypothetical protein